ncbi:carboxypeptidase N subunit 2-like [Anopheles marshallii]|uniref:carboxypeptidase N subunit 2-like n=1 Tax=Anopheles marshallii TaxID=1521116 RepID=UPI00237BD681|nr:carboxypeptidase N subunit 2-like [Anopheles marshallii]
MRTLSTILVLLVIFEAVAPETYEDGASICDRCACVIANKTASVLSYDLLDCSRKNVQHMIGSWPERFDTTDPEREIVLSLSGNNITKLQQIPATNTTLVFSCRQCGLVSLAGGLFIDTANILRVDLSFNQLSGDALSSDVFRGQYNTADSSLLLSLDELDLASNVITQIQDNAFEHIVSLRHLSLARNPLGQITGTTARALAQLVNLERLDLSYATLTDIDDTVFAEMHALRELYIQGNFFTTIPQAVYQLISLHHLDLAENPIEVLNFAQPLDQLVQLNISSMTVLHTIEIESFQNVKLLQTLTGRNNSALEVFDLTVLQHISSLKELDLSQSNLKHLHTPLEDGTTEQQDKNAFKGALEVLLLSENPWHCDCALQRVLNYVQFANLPDYDEVDETRCETPYILTSLHLSDLAYIEVCDQPDLDGPNSPGYEKPAFLRPGAIFLSLLSVAIVVGLGIIIGLVIVCLKRRLKAQGLGFTSPVRYTSVRDSTTSAVYQT